MQRLL